MKKLLLICLLFTGSCVFGQINEPVEVTPEILQSIRQQVEKQIPEFRRTLLKKELTPAEVEFTIDTFRIERVVSRMMELDWSTAGGNNAMDERTAAYDRVMNKYYNRLLKLFKPGDKKILIDAQHAWLRYRDAEKDLIWKMSEEHYSGGGTIQSNVATGRYSYLVVERTKTIFEYYDNTAENQQ